ncbi:Alpha-humulene/(-)-(E)-beta-caryophyllene synthase [Forsythia ovata]|uniref:Alpha-humulene/(-)-(E)-beta-caryophyllene synthase n=1 Tax=Forsythia ovata TaxID=205694 RepID=A0ABD1S629_9LAMI
MADILPNEEQERQILREEVKKLLAATLDDSLLKLDLIDAIQRLGVGYHFVTEIENSLKYVYDTYESYGKQDNDLHTISLRFRLLRQQGYFVSCDVFDKFKNRKGEFDESLISNVQSLLSMYEASQFRVHGEEILEEALEFSTTQLNSLVVHKKRLVRTYFQEAKWVYSGCIPSLEEYMKVGMPSSTYILMSAAALAGINGELVRKEAFEWVASDPLILRASEIIGRLMNDLVGFGFEQKISAVGCYMNQNKGASKEEAFAEIQNLVKNAWIDTNQEWLRPSPTAVPMVFLMQVIVNLSPTSEDGLTNLKVAGLIKKRLARTYFQEAKWVYSGYIPSLEEYMKVGMPSSTYILLSAAALAGINGELVSKEAFEWVASDPLILQASEIIGRLLNDLVGFGFEQKISAVGCYMNQNKGASKEEAFVEIRKLVTNAWKDINQEWLRPSPTAVPLAFLMQVIVNISRITHRMYKDIDDYTNSEANLKDIITLILIQPVTIP